MFNSALSSAYLVDPGDVSVQAVIRLGIQEWFRYHVHNIDSR